MQLVKDGVATVYNKDKKMTKGIAFPTCISINEIVGHNSPLASESTQVLAEGDMIKMYVFLLLFLQLRSDLNRSVTLAATLTDSLLWLLTLLLSVPSLPLAARLTSWPPHGPLPTVLCALSSLATRCPWNFVVLVCSRSLGLSVIFLFAECANH